MTPSVAALPRCSYRLGMTIGEQDPHRYCFWCEKSSLSFVNIRDTKRTVQAPVVVMPYVSMVGDEQAITVPILGGGPSKAVGYWAS
ncbi:hypothetical protein BC826DRAFT_1003217 [Russula brevipes]|nr:hypothetical protein BC826DRAFT_1003217 [Russula brevipes]